MNAIAMHRRRRREAGFRRIEVQVRADDVGRVRGVAQALSRDDEVARLLRQHIDRELAPASAAGLSAFDVLRMPEDDVIADVLEEVVAERPLDRVRDLDW